MIRITGGQWNGRSLKVPAPPRAASYGAGTRPTQARFRQALFNSIQFRVQDARVLDLFAGSGALGFEALSRGAAQAVFVESARGAVQCIEENRATLGVDAATAVVRSLELPEPTGIKAGTLAATLAKLADGGAFDLILIDPPYAAGWELAILEQAPWEQLLTPGGLICFEWGTKKSQVKELPERVGVLVKVREKIYGESILTTFERES